MAWFLSPMDFAHGSASGEADRRRALSELGGRLSELALVRQVHSARVVDVSEGALSELVTVEADVIWQRLDRAGRRAHGRLCARAS